MAYITRADVTALLPDDLVDKAFDLDHDGVEDVGAFDALLDAASETVDGYLAGAYDVPFTTVNATIKAAARVFALEAIYRRAGYAEEDNPYAKQAEVWRKRLAEIANGDAPLIVATAVNTGVETPDTDFEPDDQGGI